MSIPPRHSLRFRVAVAFAGLGAALSIALTVAVYLAAHDVSQRLIDETLRAEMEDQMRRHARNPASLPVVTATLRSYRSAAQGRDLPAEIGALAPGWHDLSVQAMPYRALVQERGAQRYYMLFNQALQHERERRFAAYLAGAALVTTLCSAAGGLWLARRVLAPVTRLAHAMSEAEPERPPRLDDGPDPGDELADLAQAFERYVARLHAFIERERDFAADASHELRTPLAVIAGAAEVLADDPALSGAQRERVARVQRSTEEMSRVVSALLLLAREDRKPADRPAVVAAVVRDTLQRLKPAAAARHTELKAVIHAQPELDVQEPLLAIVVGNLVRNAITHAAAGSVTVEVRADCLVVADTGVGIAGNDLDRVFERNYRGHASPGSGIGLALVKRVCDSCGWTIELDSRQGAGTSARLRFRPQTS